MIILALDLIFKAHFHNFNNHYIVQIIPSTFPVCFQSVVESSLSHLSRYLLGGRSC